MFRFYALRPDCNMDLMCNSILNPAPSVSGWQALRPPADPSLPPRPAEVLQQGPGQGELRGATLPVPSALRQGFGPGLCSRGSAG